MWPHLPRDARGGRGDEHAPPLLGAPPREALQRGRGGEAAEGEEGGEKAGEESGEEGGEGEGEEAGEALTHRGRLLELEFDGAPSGRLEGLRGVVVEVVVLQAAGPRAEGGRGLGAAGARPTHRT